MEIIKIELDKNKNRIFGIKSAILWAFKSSNKSYPLIYLRKPKHMSDEEFEDILDRLEITLKPKTGRKNYEKYIKLLRKNAKKLLANKTDADKFLKELRGGYDE